MAISVSFISSTTLASSCSQSALRTSRVRRRSGWPAVNVLGTKSAACSIIRGQTRIFSNASATFIGVVMFRARASRSAAPFATPTPFVERRKRLKDELNISLKALFEELENGPFARFLEPFERNVRNAIAHGSLVFHENGVE